MAMVKSFRDTKHFRKMGGDSQRRRMEEEEEVITRLDNALRLVAENDRHLLEFDLSERCIASRGALCLQNEFPEFNVDVELQPGWSNAEAARLARRMRQL
jgi:hypothetical protein